VSTKERIQLVQNAINSIKYRISQALENRRILEYSNLCLDLGALEQCLKIEIDAALIELDRENSFQRAEIVDFFKKAA
jgi:hypothetical protein